MTEDGCLFCRIILGQLPAEFVYEDELVVAFRDIQPMAPVHVLVVPRIHIANAGSLGSNDAEILLAMFLSAKVVAEHEGINDPDRGWRLVFNVGPDALNSVAHLHLHILGGRKMTGSLA